MKVSQVSINCWSKVSSISRKMICFVSAHKSFPPNIWSQTGLTRGLTNSKAARCKSPQYDLMEAQIRLVNHIKFVPQHIIYESRATEYHL